MPVLPVNPSESIIMRKLSQPMLWALATAFLEANTPAAAQAPSPNSTAAIAADLRMAQDAEPFRRAADAFVATAMAGDTAQTLALLSPTLVARSGEAAIQRALYTKSCPSSAAERRQGAVSP